MLTASSILSKQGEEYIHYYCCKKCNALFKSIPDLLEHGKSCVGAKILDTGGRLYAYQSSFLKGFVDCILTCGHTENCPLLTRNEITQEAGPSTVTKVVSRQGLVIVTTTGDETDADVSAKAVGKPAATDEAPGNDLTIDDNSGADSDVYDPMADDDYSDDSMPERVVQGSPVTRSRLKATEDQKSAQAGVSQKGLSTRSNNKSQGNKEGGTLKEATPKRIPATRSKGKVDASEGQGKVAGTPITIPAPSTPTTRSKRKAQSLEEQPTLIATRSQTTPNNANTVQKTHGTRSKEKGVERHDTSITRTPQKSPTTRSKRGVNTISTPNASPAQKTPPDHASSLLEPHTPKSSEQQTPTTASEVTKKQENVTTHGTTVQKTPVSTTATVMSATETPTTSSNIKVKVVTRKGNKNVITDAFLRRTTPTKKNSPKKPLPPKTSKYEPKPIEEPENEAIKAMLAKARYRPIRPKPIVTDEPQNVATKSIKLQKNTVPNPKVNAGQQSIEQESSNSTEEDSVEPVNETLTTNTTDTTGKDAPEPKDNAEPPSAAMGTEGNAENQNAVLKLKVTNVLGNVTKLPRLGSKKKLAGADLVVNHTCLWCDFNSDTSTALKLHMKIHLRRKLWQCAVCGHEAVSELKMSAHIEQKHAGCRFEDAAIRLGLQEKESVPDKDSQPESSSLEPEAAVLVSDNDEQPEQLQDTSSHDTRPTRSTGMAEESDKAKEDEVDVSALESMLEYDDIELNYDMKDESMLESDGALIEHWDPGRGDHCYGLTPKLEPPEEAMIQTPLEETTQPDTTIKFQVRKALPPHRCNHCFYRTWNKARFLKHVRGHSIVEKQPSVLPKTALKASNLKERWYGCPRCNFETGHGGSFRKHMMVHFGIHPWECAICGKRALTQQAIQLHISWQHKHCSVEDQKDAAIKHDLKFDLNLYDFRIPNVGVRAAGNKQKSSKGKVKVSHNLKSPPVSERMDAIMAREYACQWCDYKSDSTTGLEHHLMSHVRSNLWQCVVCGHEDATESKMSAHLEQKHIGCRFEDAAIRLGLQEKEPVPDKDSQPESSSLEPEAAVLGDNQNNPTPAGSEAQDERTVNTMSLQTPENMQILLEVASEEITTYLPITDPALNFAIASGTFAPGTDSGANFAVAGPSHVSLPEADWQFNTTPSKSGEYFTIEMYGCDSCDFKIGNATRFKQHMLSHQGIKPWQCKICGLGDANKFNISVHVKSFHKDSIRGKPMKYIDDMSKAVDIDLESYKIVCKRRRTKKK